MSDVKLELLEKKINCIKDILDIKQVLYRYAQNMALYRADKIIELFAQRPDSTLEIVNDGVLMGIENIKKFYGRTEMLGKSKGSMVEHYTLCPIIEVSKDGKTAKATCFSPGIVSIADINQQGWNWGKYYVAFRKEGGKWKIWHMHFYQMFECSYEKGWLHEQQRHAAAGIKGGLPFPEADRPTTYHKPYDPKQQNYFLPEPPEPYDTWDENWVE